MTSIDWTFVLPHAAAIVLSYDTRVTLRQLFYQLVAHMTLRNTQTVYKQLSSRTAEARRHGASPNLTDLNRRIHRRLSFAGPDQARSWLSAVYRRAQLDSWFGDRGLPILALGGFASQSYVKQIVDDVEAQGRPAVLLYAGDFDPSGEDGFLQRMGAHPDRLGDDGAGRPGNLLRWWQLATTSDHRLGA
jgi:hypothetical protein